MEFGEVLRRRRMIRSYDMTRPVPPAAIDAVLAAALRAPSAGFTQGISFLVLSSDAERETFWRLTGDSDTAWLRGMRTAPVLVLVWTSEEAYLDRYAEPEGLDRPRSGALVRALLVRRRRHGKHGGAAVGGRPASRRLLLRHSGGPDCRRTRNLRRPGKSAERRCDQLGIFGSGARRAPHQRERAGTTSAQGPDGPHPPQRLVMKCRVGPAILAYGCRSPL